MTSTATYAHFGTRTADRYSVLCDLLATGLTEAVRELAAANGCHSTVAFATEAERDAFVALFPKSVNVRKNVMYHRAGVLPCAEFSVATTSTGVTGAVNETGAKRLARYTAILATVFPAR